MRSASSSESVRRHCLPAFAADIAAPYITTSGCSGACRTPPAAAAAAAAARGGGRSHCGPPTASSTAPPPSPPAPSSPLPAPCVAFSKRSSASCQRPPRSSDVIAVDATTTVGGTPAASIASSSRFASTAPRPRRPSAVKHAEYEYASGRNPAPGIDSRSSRSADAWSPVAAHAESAELKQTRSAAMSCSAMASSSRSAAFDLRAVPHAPMPIEKWRAFSLCGSCSSACASVAQLARHLRSRLKCRRREA